MGETHRIRQQRGHRPGLPGHAPPGAASTAGIIVLQEWWGLVDQIKRTCDRFAEAGFTALAPDLYHGKTVPLTEPDEAGKEMMASGWRRRPGT